MCPEGKKKSFCKSFKEKAFANLSPLPYCFFFFTSVPCVSSSVVSTGPMDHPELSPMGWGMFPLGQAHPRASGTSLLQRLPLFQTLWLGYKYYSLFWGWEEIFPHFLHWVEELKACVLLSWGVTVNSLTDGVLGQLFFRIRSKKALALCTFTKSCSLPLCSPASETWQMKRDRCFLTCPYHKLLKQTNTQIKSSCHSECVSGIVAVRIWDFLGPYIICLMLSILFIMFYTREGDSNRWK